MINMNTDQTFQSQPEVIQTPVREVPMPPPSSNSNRKWYLIAFVIVVVVLVLISKLMQNGTNQSNSRANVIPTSTPIPITHDYPGTMTLRPSSSQIKVGETAVVQVVISAPGRSLDGADSILTFDSSLLEATITKTAGFPSYVKKKSDNGGGKVTITGVTFEAKPPPSSSDIIFAEISFKAKKVGDSDVTLVFNKGDKSLSTIIENGTSYSLLGSVENAKITVTQ